MAIKSYKAIKRHIQISALKNMSTELIHDMLSDQKEKIFELEAENEKLNTLITECTDCGELDSKLFNSYMEHVIKS